MRLSHAPIRLTIVLSFLCLKAPAQLTNVTGDQAQPVAGVGHDYVHLLNETVNPASGALSIRIEVPLPAGRGPNLKFSVGYDSNAARHYSPPNSGTAGSNTSYLANGGWSYIVPQLTLHENDNVRWLSSPPQRYDCYFFTDYMMTDGVGNLHALAISAAMPPTSVNCSTGTGGPFAVNPANEYLSGGDTLVQAVTSAVPTPTFSVPPSVKAADHDGTVYQFATMHVLTSNNTWTALPSYIEDRNGNKVLFSDSGNGAFTITDSLGRNLLVSSGFGSSGNTITVSGLGGPYNLTWGTASGTQSLASQTTHDPGDSGSCANGGFNMGALPTITSILLPNGKSYSFQYDSFSGNVSKIIYPTGGYVRFVWGANSLSDNATYDDSLNTLVCHNTHDTQAITDRYVSFDGTTEVLHQHFAYSTTWVPDGNSSTGQHWTSKSTTITSYDLGLGTNFQKVYGYTPFYAAQQPNDPVLYGGGASPTESSATTYSTTGSVLLTQQKTWGAGTMVPPTQETTTLDSGQVSQVNRTYNSNKILTDVYSYDYGSGSPGAVLKQVHTDYAAFAATPIFPSALSILDRPADVITYDGTGTRVAETDYSYDQAAIAAVTATGHDDTNYGTSQTVRGNATTQTKKCFVGATSCNDSIITYTYDQTGQVLSSKDPCGNGSCSDMTGSNHTITYSYTDSYTVLSGGSNNPYTPSGNTNAFLSHITDPLGHNSQFTYDFNNSQLTISKDQNDINGSLTGDTYLYNDAFARPTSSQSADGGQETFSYNDSSYNQTNNTPNVQKTKLIVAGSTLTHTTAMDGVRHEARALLTSDPVGTDTGDLAYDGLGHLRTKSNPHRTGSSSTDGTTTYNYDSLGRTTSVLQADGSTSTTTYSGNCHTVADEAGKSRKSCSDALGRLTQVFEDPNALNYETDYAYDSLGNMLTVNQKGGDSNSSNWRTRTFTYDSLSRLLTANNPETGTVTYTYDVNANVSTKSDARGVTISYTYDALNRLTGKSYSNGDGAITYSYDVFASGTNYGIRRRTGMIDSSGSTTWTYDTMGRIWSEKRIIGSVNETISTQYNLDGSVKQITYPSGTVLVYSYDSAEELTQVKDTTNNITYFQNASYFPPGQLNQATYGSVVETSIMNNRSQPCWYYATTGSPLAANTVCSGTASPGNVLDLKYNLGFGSNDNGNLLNLTNDKDSNRSVAYTYDALNRIASAATPNTDCSTLPSGITKNWGETFAVDPWGNLTNRTVTKCAADGLSVVALNNNRLSGFGYGSDGNMTSNGGATYTYTAENRLKTAGGVTYTYNGDGERVKKSSGTLYWGSGPLLESDLSGNLQREFIFANGKRIARRDIPGGTVYYYFADQVGSADVVTSSAGTIQNESDYFPYGAERVYSQTLTNQNYKFTGKERDPESGLDNFEARYDSSALGRFMTPDWDIKPVTVPYAVFGDPQSLNLYAYVENAPVNRADADGHGCDRPVGGNESTNVGTTGQSCEQLNHTLANTNSADASQTTLTEKKAQNQRDDGLGLVRDFLDIVDVSVSAGISAKASAQFGVAEYGAEATLIGGEASSGLGGGNADASVVSKAKAFGKIGEAEADVEVGGKLSARDGASASASANAGVGPAQVGGSMSVDREGGHIQPAAAASKDFKVGASVRAGVGVGVNINFSQGARAVQHLYNVFAQIGNVVLPRVPGL